MLHKNIYWIALLCTTISYAKEPEIARWEKGGVIFEQPRFVLIDPTVEKIGKGTSIGCGVHILGNTCIGEKCSIGHYSILKNCTLGDNVKIHSHCVLENATIESGAEIGPFAHIHEGSIIQEKAAIGNFVEVKRSNIGAEAKAKHLTYLGDATLGKKVNVGAGTITCNYNGVSKHPTDIDDNVFIGSNNCLIAPVHIGKGAMTAAGSTITKDVPADALAIARAPEQINKEGYAPILLDRYRQEKEHKQ